MSKENLQAMFNKVVRHLHAQNARALDERGECVYRTPDGKMCAFGVLIPDELYDPKFEGYGVSGLPLHVLKACGVVNEEAKNLAMRLQSIHDVYALPTEWPSLFKTVAVDFGLDDKVVTDCYGVSYPTSFSTS